MNDKFSMSRVWFLIRRYFSENFRQLSMTVGVVFGIMLFFAIMINRTFDESIIDGGAVLWTMFLGIIGFSLTVVGSLTFSSMSTKPKRIVAMMVPASKLEKFVSLLLIYNSFGPIVLILCALVVDLLTSLMFFHAPFFIQLIANANEFLKSISLTDYGIEVMFGVIAFIGGSLLCSLATYTLGSSLWPKKSFIKTFCVLFAVQIFTPFFIPGNWSMRFIQWLSDLNYEDLNVHLLAWGGIALIYAVAAFIYWLTWRRYRSTQLIQKFMMD